jgi:uncharacterized 2Fe-2S/4Fe-4S cluster protein (DUF4445 family)
MSDRIEAGQPVEPAGAAAEFTVAFQPSGARGRVKAGTSLRTAARQLGVEIESVCAENATCGKCRVLIESGTFDRMGLRSSPDHVTPLGPAEEGYLAQRREAWRRSGQPVENLRLSCQARVCGDVMVFVPESSRGNRQVVRKSATERAIEIRPAIRRYYVALEPATLENPLGDWERLARALVPVMQRANTEPGWAAPSPDDLRFDFRVLQFLSQAIQAGDWKLTVAVWNDREVIDVRPGYHDEVYGAAVDIGSTTIALYLCDLVSGEVIATESMMNPQTAYGEDIMTRMTYEVRQTDGLEKLHKAAVDAINTLLKRARRARRLTAKDVLELVLVGNTTMHHLVLGMTTQRLGIVPYAPTVHRELDIKARDLGLDVHPAANVHVLPIEASFVGADNMAVLIAEAPYNQDEQWLIIDIGTNAEIVLGNRQRLVCTSTPTGPAFEGGMIEHGMRAAPGAIERVEIDPATLEPRYHVIGQEGWNSASPGGAGQVKGICGSGVIDAVAEMFRAGIVSPRGRFVQGLASPRVRQGDSGWEYVLAWHPETSVGRDIVVTIQDVRQIQLAKAALYTATQILLREMGLERPDKIILAGGFGSYIDPQKAMILGMIPDCPLENVYAVGNAAGDGARIALLNRHKRQEAARVARGIQRIELPIDPEFQNRLMLALNFPHMTDTFPHIAHLIPRNGPDPMAERIRKRAN